MKKIYIKPTTVETTVFTDNLLNNASGVGEDPTKWGGGLSKKNDFDFWETEDMGVADGPKTKSVWE